MRYARTLVLACLAMNAVAAGAAQLETRLVGFLPESLKTLEAPTGPLSDSLDDVTIFGTGFHSATVDYGSIRSFSRSFSEGDTYSGWATASFTDDLTFDVPGLEGTVGTVVIGLGVDGDLSHLTAGASGSDRFMGEVGYEVIVERNGGQLHVRSGTLRIRPGPDGTGGEEQFFNSPFGSFDVELPVVFGSAFEMTVQLTARSAAWAIDTAPPGATHTAISDLTNTLQWEGIREVRDSEDQVRADFELSSGSGVDWRNAIALEGPLRGDANNDGLVSGSDLIAVQQHFGKVGPPHDGTLLGDANDDGSVTGADLIAVQENFGKALNPAVPEPATLLLFVLGVPWVASRRLGAPRAPRSDG